MIKILLADDQCLMLEGIKAILKHEPEIEVVGTARDGQSAIAQVEKLQPDIVLIDIEMPKMNGIMATKHICESMPDIRVIVLTSHKNEDYITQALQAGASGYLLKDNLIEDLKQAIYSLGNGYSYPETKLLTKTVNKIQTANVIRYPEKIAYLKKYRKSIYKPTVIKKEQISESPSHKRSTYPGITKASLAPIFDPSSQELTAHFSTPNRRNLHSPKFNRRKYIRRICWLLVAIASFMLSIIIF